MGLLSSILPGTAPASEEAQRAEAIRAGTAVPSRAERQRCWDSRDVYFGCLDRNSIVDAVEPAGAAAAQKACAKESEQLDRDCAAQWVRFSPLSLSPFTLGAAPSLTTAGCPFQKVPGGQLPEGQAAGGSAGTGRPGGADQQRAGRLGSGEQEVGRRRAEKKRQEK